MTNRRLYLLAKRYVIAVEKNRERAEFVSDGDVAGAALDLAEYFYGWEEGDDFDPGPLSDETKRILTEQHGIEFSDWRPSRPCPCGDPGDCNQC